MGFECEIMPATPETRAKSGETIISIEDVLNELTCDAAGKDHLKIATHVRARLSLLSTI